MSAQSKQVVFLVAAEGIEQVELTHPWEAVKEAGATPVLVSPESGTVQAYHHLDKGDTFPVDRTVAEVSVDEVDALVLPGGVANPDALRLDEKAVALVREVLAAGKPVAAICHAPWVLVEADVVKDRKVTSYPSVRTDLTNAGATWVDEKVVVDGNLITSRNPDDLEAFSGAVVESVFHGSAQAGAQAE